MIGNRSGGPEAIASGSGIVSLHLAPEPVPVFDAEGLLVPAAERWRAIVETAVDAVISIDKDGRIETSNPAAVGLFGYPADEVVGRNVKMLMPSDVAAAHDGYLRRALDGGPHR